VIIARDRKIQDRLFDSKSSITYFKCIMVYVEGHHITHYDVPNHPPVPTLPPR